MRRPTYDEVVCLFMAALILVLCVHSYVGGICYKYELNNGLFCAAFCTVPVIMKRTGALVLPGPFVILILAAIAFHAFGVLYFSYDELYYYDNLTHTLSSVTVSACVYLTLVCYQVYNRSFLLPPAMMSLASAMFMMTFSVGWELFEYVVDVSTGTNMQFSPTDTLRDMLCNTIAASAASAWMYFYVRKRGAEEIVESLRIHPLLRRFVAWGSDGKRRVYVFIK